jgi:hypothetical protein
MADSAVDPKKIERKRDRSKRDAITRETVIKSLMSHPDGRRYIWLELEEAKVFQQTLVLGPGGPEATAFNEGKRSGGLRLLTEVTRLCPDDYMKMTKENASVKLKEDDDEPPAPEYEIPEPSED